MLATAVCHVTITNLLHTAICMHVENLIFRVKFFNSQCCSWKQFPSNTDSICSGMD